MAGLRRLGSTLASLAAIALASAVAAAAEDGGRSPRDQDAAYSAHAQGLVRSLDSVLSATSSGGKVLDAELEGSRYRVKVLENDGRVHSVDVDASFGGSGSRGSAGESRRGDDESSGGRGRGRGR